MPENPTSPRRGTQNPAVIDEDVANHLEPQIPTCREPMDNPLPKYEGDAWKDVLEYIAEPHRAQCKAWKEEVETLLIFAGLFSAVVTAFIIESYKSLREDFGDTSTALLRRIALQLEGNGTAALPPASAFEPSSSSIRVNTLWFLSLILSLTTVLIGTLCLQWLREHLNVPSDPRKALPLYHMQEESLLRWYVPQIFTTLPLLLQSAVIIFFVGVVDFLWQLHHTVAIVSLAFIGAAVIFYVVTTIAPTIQDCLLAFPRVSTSGIPRSPCPYRSPQSLLFLQMVAPLVIHFFRSCIPMGWIWKLYWSNHYDHGCDRHRQERNNLARIPYSTNSWISHHKSWLLQRDLDVIFSLDLHQIDAHSHTTMAIESIHMYLYDNVEALCSLVDTNAMAGSIAPWVCIDEYLRDMTSTAQWSRVFDLKIFLDAVQDRQDFISGKEDLEFFSFYPRMTVANLAFCTFHSGRLPPTLLRPHWFEKHIRVLGSCVQEFINITDRRTTSSVVRQFVRWYQRSKWDIPETLLSCEQEIVNALLAAPTATWEPERQIEAADIFCSLFVTLAYRTAANYSSPSVRSRHKATLQIAASSIRTSEVSTTFLVTMISYYLFIFFDSLRQRHLDSAVKESTELLSLIRSYRVRHLGAAFEDSTERSTLLAIQTLTFSQVLHLMSFTIQHRLSGGGFLIWRSYFMGMFDATDGVTHNLFSESVGSFVKPRNHHSPHHVHRIGGCELQPAIIEIVDNVAGTSGQLQDETATDALFQDVGVDEG